MPDMYLLQRFIAPAGLLFVTLLSITACGHETPDCRPNDASESVQDRALLTFLEGNSFSLHSYVVAGETSVPAVSVPGGRGAHLSFLEDGYLQGGTGVNEISGLIPVGSHEFPGRYFVKDRKLHLCGKMAASQRIGRSPELRAQDEAFLKVFFASPEIAVQGRSIVLSAQGSSLTAISISSKTP